MQRDGLYNTLTNYSIVKWFFSYSLNTLSVMWWLNVIYAHRHHYHLFDDKEMERWITWIKKENKIELDSWNTKKRLFEFAVGLRKSNSVGLRKSNWLMILLWRIVRYIRAQRVVKKSMRWIYFSWKYRIYHNLAH